jgi:hypothetical protein
MTSRSQRATAATVTETAPTGENFRGRLARLRLVRADVAACATELDLELFLVAPERSGVAAHVDACDHCQRRVAEMRRAGEAFHRQVYPATLWAVLRAMHARIGSPVEARPSVEHLLRNGWRAPARHALRGCEGELS